MRFLLICITAILGGGCASHSTPAGSLAGTYEWNIWTAWTTIQLLPNGRYVAKSGMDIYPDSGSAEGTWRSEGNVVYLEPREEEGDLEGDLRALVVQTVDGKRALVRKKDVGRGMGVFYLKTAPIPPAEPISGTRTGDWKTRCLVTLARSVARG